MHIRDQFRFEELMRLQRMPQRRLIEQAQVSRAFISMAMHGLRSARAATTWRISSALGASIGELFTAHPFTSLSSIGEDNAAA